MKSHTKALLLAASVAIMAAGAAQAGELKLVTGPQGGSWYPLGGALKNLIEKGMAGTTVQVGPGAGIANVKAIEAGKADMGFANSVSTVDAIGGKAPFEKAYKNVCNVGTLYPQYFQVVALADAGIKSPADLKGKALTTQKKGNTGEQITEHLLQAYGMKYDDLSKVSQGSYTDSVNQLKDGNAQWFTLGTTVPASAIMDLASARDVTIVEIPDDGLKKMQEINPGYKRIVIKAGSYPKQDKDVGTVGYATHVIARCDLDADTVYNTLKAMEGGMGDLAAVAKAMKDTDAKGMALDIGVPMHKGAEKFYKEKGVL
ncbi:MAG: TAXI family TRAP transporter solute-binding subunit [Pseudomonadota bacterium]|nr:TAXI family TRAP transporter solute-binding subunit [Pseudomonadota bacterium]